MHIQETLRHYAQVICNHFRLILFGVIFGSTITFVVSLFLPPVYQASALVKVDSVPMMTAATASGNDIFSAQAQAVGYALLVTSPEVLQEAASKLPRMTLDQLRRAVSDSPVDNTQLIEIRANANSPQKAADVANTVATTFVQFQESQERTRLQNAADQLSQNLTQAKINIDTAQKQLTLLQKNTHSADDSIAQQQSLLATYQSTYNALLSNNEQLQTQVQQTARMLSVTQQALSPDKPTSPQIALNTILAASMSLILMVSLVLLQDWLDVTIKTVDDVVQLTGLEPLGSIPLSASSPEFDLRSEHADEIKNAYSMLGTSFRVLSRGERAILVISPRSRSGTTTAATYLALSLAKSGMRVLLVDANVRCPSRQSVLLCPDTHDSVKSLQEIASWKEALPCLWLDQWKTDIPSLWLLPVGLLGQTPSSLLHEPALGQLVDRLLGRMPDTSKQLHPRLVDMVIFDTAALDQGVDAYLLAALADATVLVVEAGKERKDTLCRLSATFQQFGAPILGVVVNRQGEHHRSYFYAPSQVSAKREIGVSPLLDQAPLLPLPQENASGEEKGQISIKRSLTLESLVDRKGIINFYRDGKHKLQNISAKGLGGSVEIEVELPETPVPLPLVYSDVTANRSTDQTNEVQDNAPGRLQFAPLLRFSRAMSQDRKDESSSKA